MDLNNFKSGYYNATANALFQDYAQVLKSHHLGGHVKMTVHILFDECRFVASALY